MASPPPRSFPLATLGASASAGALSLKWSYRTAPRVTAPPSRFARRPRPLPLTHPTRQALSQGLSLHLCRSVGWGLSGAAPFGRRPLAVGAASASHRRHLQPPRPQVCVGSLLPQRIASRSRYARGDRSGSWLRYHPGRSPSLRSGFRLPLGRSRCRGVRRACPRVCRAGRVGAPRPRRALSRFAPDPQGRGVLVSIAGGGFPRFVARVADGAATRRGPGSPPRFRSAGPRLPAGSPPCLASARWAER